MMTKKRKTETKEKEARPIGRRLIFGGIVALILAGAAMALWLAGKGSAATSRFGGEPPDIILVTVDTLRWDAVGHVKGLEVRTPFIDRLAAEGRVFTNAHAHNVVTFPSHANILTGLYPYEHGVRDNAGFKLSPSHRTLATILREQGYATGGFVSAFPLDRRFGLDQGFDVYDDKYREGTVPSAFIVPERPGFETLEAATRWWKEQTDRKRFLWVHIYEPHAPYEPPAPFSDLYDDPYLGEVAAADAALEKYLTPILEDNDNVLVVFTSDHGEARGEHGEMTHGLFAYEETLKVPMILREPGRIRPAKVDEYVRHIDIVPTILERLRIEPAGELPGRSLLDVEADRDTYFESLTANVNMGWAPLVGMIHQRHKYVDLPIAELYDLEKDPLEKSNILTEERRMTFRIRDLMEKAAPNASAFERNLSPEESKKLLALGYITGSSDKTEFTEADDPKNLVQYFTMIHKIVNHYQKGENEKAIDVARQLLEERPEMDTAKEMLAFVLQQSERPDDAIELLRDEIRAGGGNDATRKRLGLILSETGRAEEAVEILSAFSNSEDPDLLNAYGIALADLGRLNDAVGIFQRVLQLDSSNATAYQNLGVVALRAGDVPRARRYLEQALSLNEEMPLALNTYGVVMMQMQDPRGAIQAWSRAVKIDPKQYDALFNLSLVAGRTGQLDLARKSLQQFIDSAPPERYGKDIEQARRMLNGLPQASS